MGKEKNSLPPVQRAMPILHTKEFSGTLPRPVNIHVQGLDEFGQTVDFEVKLVEGSITENGHCRFI